MVLTRILSQQEYGEYRKIWLVYSILGPAFINILAGIIYYRSKTSLLHLAVYSNLFISFFLATITTLIIVLPATFWAELFSVPEQTAALRIFGLYAFFSIIAGVAEPLFISLRRNKWLLTYTTAYNLIEFCLIVGSFMLGLELYQIFAIMTLGPLMRTGLIAAVVWNAQLPKPEWRPVWEECRTSFSYGSGLLILSLTGVAMVQTDKWIIGLFFESDSIFAIYEVGAKKLPFLFVLTAAASSSLISEFSDQLKRGEYKPALDQAKSAAGTLSVIILPLCTVLYVYAEEVLFILFGGYSESAPIFRIYLFMIATQLVFPQSIVLGAGRSGVNAAFSVAEFILNIVLGVALVTWIGLTGPAWASLLAHIFFTVMMLFYCRIIMGIPLKSFIPGKLARPLLYLVPALFLIAAGLKYYAWSSWPGFILSTAVATVIITLLILTRRRHGGGSGR